MKRITVPADEIVPLSSIASGVAGVRIIFVNVFAITTSRSWTLIDAGLTGSAVRLQRWAEQTFGDVPPEAIVLTHAHFDHVGAIDELLDRWRVPVYVHRDELPYATGARSY